MDCITVNTLPVKTVIDDHIQQLYDALMNSLRRSISVNVQGIDGFLNEAFESLSVKPQTVEEIGRVNALHHQLSKQKLEVNNNVCILMYSLSLFLSLRFFHSLLKQRRRIVYCDQLLGVVWNS